MSGWGIDLLVVIGVAAVGARRPGTSAALVVAQTLLVGVIALAHAPGRPVAVVVASGLVLAKGAVLAAILVVTLRRTHEERPPHDATSALARLAGAVGLVLAAVALVPAPAGAAGAALLATALALVLLRRATIFAILALLVSENAVAAVALGTGGGLPLAVELGMAFDLVVVAAVAAVLQRRILSTFGTTDSAVLRVVRD